MFRRDRSGRTHDELAAALLVGLLFVAAIAIATAAQALREEVTG